MTKTEQRRDDPYLLRRRAETTVVQGFPATLKDGVTIPAQRWRGGTFRHVDALPLDLRPERDTSASRQAYRSLAREQVRADRHSRNRPGWYARRAAAYGAKAVAVREAEDLAGLTGEARP